MTGARRPKPLKLKESVENETANFDVKLFLGKGAQLKAMVPSSRPDQTKEFSQTLPLPDNNQTSASALTRDLKQPQQKQKSSVRWIDPSATTVSGQKIKRERKDFLLGPALMFVGAIGLIGYVIWAPSGVPTGSTGKKLTAAELKERLEYHQKTTGWRLNNQRIETQIENYHEAPSLPTSTVKVKPDDMMNGLPLEGERNSLEGSRDKTMPVNPTYTDAKIMYGLQEEQERIETEKRAEKLYTQEFIANAAADGYDVKVDKKGNIVQIKKLKPNRVPQGSYNELGR